MRVSVAVHGMNLFQGEMRTAFFSVGLTFARQFFILLSHSRITVVLHSFPSREDFGHMSKLQKIHLDNEFLSEHHIWVCSCILHPVKMYVFLLMI